MITIEAQNIEQAMYNVLIDDTLKLIYERRSIRKYKNIPVERELIERIIDAGRMAPSAINLQPWRFYIVTKPEDISFFSKEIKRNMIEGIIKSDLKNIIKSAKEFLHFPHKMNFLKEADPVFHGAPVVIFISSPSDSEWASIDIGMCSQNIMLAAKSLGLDSCPIGMVKYGSAETFSKLNVPVNEQIRLAIILGYGDENPKAATRIKTNLTFI
jgi:nitroreductase